MTISQVLAQAAKLVERGERRPLGPKVSPFAEVACWLASASEYAKVLGR